MGYKDDAHFCSCKKSQSYYDFVRINKCCDKFYIRKWNQDYHYDQFMVIKFNVKDNVIHVITNFNSPHRDRFDIKQNILTGSRDIKLTEVYFRNEISFDFLDDYLERYVQNMVFE